MQLTPEALAQLAAAVITLIAAIEKLITLVSVLIMPQEIKP